MQKVLNKSVKSAPVRRMISASALLTKSGMRSNEAPSSATGSMPDFLIIGAQRSGTTSLYRYLTQHRSVAPACRKEINFFTSHFENGIEWYRSQFPSIAYRSQLMRLLNRRFITGEASTSYMMHPLAAKSVKEAMPEVKLIALLRNPINRAWSHYVGLVRRGIEPLSFEEAIHHEEGELLGELAGVRENPSRISLRHQFKGFTSREVYGYLARGMYADQLAIWSALFPKEQLLVLKSEDFFSDLPTVFSQVLEFLELPAWQPKKFNVFNSRTNQPMYSSMSPDTRDYLVEFFKPHNERLSAQLGMNFLWDSP